MCGRSSPPCSLAATPGLTAGFFRPAKAQTRKQKKSCCFGFGVPSNPRACLYIVCTSAPYHFALLFPLFVSFQPGPSSVGHKYHSDVEGCYSCRYHSLTLSCSLTTRRIHLTYSIPPAIHPPSRPLPLPRPPSTRILHALSPSINLPYAYLSCIPAPNLLLPS